MQISDKVKNAVTSRIAEAKKRVVQSMAPKTVKNSPQASKPSLDIVSIVKSGMSKTSPNFTTRSNSWQYKPDGTRKTFDELTNAEVLTWISTLDKSEQQGAALDFETNYLKNPGSTRYDPYYTSYSNNDEARALFGVNTFDQKWIDANRQAYMPYVHFSGEKYTSPKAPGKYASDLEKTAYQYWLIANTYEQTTQAAENEYAKLRAEIAEKAKIYRASGEGVTAQELLDGIDWSEYETLENLREASRAGNGRYLNRPVQVGDSSLTAMINAALRGEDVSGAKDYLWEESRYILSGGSRKAQTQAAAEAEQTDERAYNTSNNYDPYYADISNNAEARALFGVETFDQAWIDANRGKYMQYIDFGGEDKKTPVKPGKDASQIEKDAYQYWLIANTYEETTREGEKELEKLREWMKKKADRYTAEEIVGQIDWEDYPTLQNMREVAEAGNARMINRPVKAGDESILQMARELTGEIGENADESDVSAPDPEAMVNVADSDVAKAPANGSGYWDWWQQFGQVMGDIVSVSREQQKKAVDISDGIQYNKFVGSLRSSMSLDASIAFMRSQASALNFVASEEDRAMYRQQLELLEMERDERQRIEERVRAEVDAAVGGNGGRNLGERIIDDLMQNLIISGADQVPIQDYEAYLRNHMGLETGQNPEMDKYDAPTAGEERAGLIALGAAEGFDKAATATTQGAEYVLYEIKRRLPWNQGKTKEELYYTDRDLNALYGWNQQFSRKWVEDSERERLAAEYPVFNQVSMGVSELIKMIGQATGASIVPGMPGMSGWYGMDLLKNGGKVARTIENTLGKAANSMPFYLDSYAQTYETALEEGATEDQAGMAAAINAMASGWLSSKAVEGLGKLGGSVTRLFTSRIGKRAAQKGLTNVFKSGWGEALLAIGKAAISEGSEEAIEEPIQSGIAKLVYDRDRAWYGKGAVIDPQAMLESGVGGAIAGPMFTVASGLSGALGQTARQKSEEILERTGRGEIVPLDEIEELGRIEAREAEIQDATETLAAQRQPEIDAAGEKAQAAMDAATAAQERAEAAQAELNTRVEEAQPVMQAINEGTASYEDPEVQKEVSTRSDAIKQAREGLTLANTELAQEQTRAAEAAQEAQETIDRIREEARTEATAQVDANIEAERQAEALATGEIRGDETREMLGKAAGKTLREYKSSADRAETAARLSAMSEAYAAGKYAEAEAIADQLAREIIEKSSDVDMSVPRQYAETRKRLREEGVSLTDTQKQETANQYGSYNDFRKSLMGSVKIKNDAKSLVAIWGELSGMHPEMFPAETGEGEMPGKLMEFVQAMKPKYVNPYGMDMEGAAADLSLRLQSDVLGLINEPDRAKAALADANALRERYSRENSEKRRQAREERQKKFREAADKLFAAREAGDTEAEQAAVDEYRKLRAGTSGRARLADAAEAGIQIRKAGREIGRLDRLIAQMNETIEGKDLDNEASIERLIEERNTYIEMRDQLKRQQNALHRQEMIARAGMDAAQDADEWEADVAMNDAINVDTAEHIDSLRSSIHDKVNQLAARMKAKMADYNMTSTIDVNDVEFFFEDVLGEMQMQSGMVKVWEERLAAAERQLDMEKKIQQQLQKRVDLHEGGDGVDVNALRVQISEAKDRIDALESARRTADREATYARRVGAESLQKALREGRLPQPIMERVIAIFSEAGRRGKFNSTLLMQNMEATRLNYTTAARVWDDLFGDLAPIIRGIYYDPVMDNETDRQKWINEWRGRISELKLTKQESEAVQRVGEGKLTLDEAVEFGSVEKIQQAVELFRQFYDEAWDMADRAMVRNGYESPGKRARYFPHIDEAKNFWQKLGLPIESSTLPTSINGLTETFSPGKQYSGHLQHREGDTTDYDALAGFEEYIASVSNVIYHTDDIQRMRQLETEIRAAANNGLFKSLKNGSGKEHLSEFVKWVHEYTNLLAGKKSSSDRGIESPHGRAIYRTLNKLRSMKGRSAVMGNAASAITNFVPVQQVIGEHPVAAVKAAAQLHMGNVIGQGNVPESQYLIRRFGSDSVVKTAYTRFSKAAGWGFEAVDHLASKLVVATYYQANLDMGMDSETAMRSADAKAARLMGDRSKGAMPNVYGSQFIGFLTQFQYEVANQSQHFRKDIWREKGLGKGLVTVFMTALTGWLFNEVQERITGRRSAMDPIDMTMDAWKVWQDTGELLPVAQSIYNNVSDIFPYIGMLGDGGRITAFEGISDLMSAMLAGDGDLGYSLKQFAWDIVPMGGQIKKSWRGALALARGGYYNSKGDKLYFPVEASNPFEAAQALIFGPTSIRAAVDYYAGDADALTASETKAYQQDMARGMTATEAYQNEVKQAQAEDLMAEAKETEETPIDAEKQQAAGIQMTPEGQQKLEKAQADADTVDAKRDEARALREQTVPSELMSDRYWALKDSDQLKAAIRLWQISGDDWAMPYTYDEMRKFTIDGEAEYLGPELADFANKYYEDEYMTLMAGVDPERMDEEELADLKVDIEKIKTSLDKELRKMIEDERR